MGDTPLVRQSELYSIFDDIINDLSINLEEVTKMLFAVSLIGITTFSLSSVGLGVGNVFGTKYKSKAELAGGIILVLMGFKILLEHTGILQI